MDELIPKAVGLLTPTPIKLRLVLSSTLPPASTAHLIDTTRRLSVHGSTMVKIGAKLRSPTRRERRDALRNERRACMSSNSTTTPTRPVSGTQLGPIIISDSGVSSHSRKARRTISPPEDTRISKKLRERRKDQLSGKRENDELRGMPAQILRFVTSRLILNLLARRFIPILQKSYVARGTWTALWNSIYFKL